MTLTDTSGNSFTVNDLTPISVSGALDFSYDFFRSDFTDVDLTMIQSILVSTTWDGQSTAIIGKIVTTDEIPNGNGNGMTVGGKIIPIETTSLLLANAQSFSWMIPVILSGIGIGLFAVSRKSE